MSTRLDHVALATTDVTEPLRVLVGELGGTILAGGHSVGFRPMQVHMGDAHARFPPTSIDHSPPPAV